MVRPVSVTFLNEWQARPPFRNKKSLKFPIFSLLQHEENLKLGKRYPSGGHQWQAKIRPGSNQGKEIAYAAHHENGGNGKGEYPDRREHTPGILIRCRSIATQSHVSRPKHPMVNG